MTDHIPTEAIEAAARALAMLGPDEEWPSNEALGGGLTGTRDDEYRNSKRDEARAALSAALPFLRPELSEDERDLIGLLASHGEYVEVETAIQYVRDAGFTRRPMPSREQVAHVVSDYLAPILGQSPGGPSQMDYGLADAVLALFKGADRG